MTRGPALALRPDDDEFKRCAEAAFGRAGLIGRIFGLRYDRRTGLRPDQVKHLGAYAAIVKVTLR